MRPRFVASAVRCHQCVYPVLVVLRNALIFNVGFVLGYTNAAVQRRKLRVVVRVVEAALFGAVIALPVTHHPQPDSAVRAQRRCFRSSRVLLAASGAFGMSGNRGGYQDWRSAFVFPRPFVPSAFAEKTLNKASHPTPTRRVVRRRMASILVLGLHSIRASIRGGWTRRSSYRVNNLYSCS
jgi:hypothetical protein